MSREQFVIIADSEIGKVSEKVDDLLFPYSDVSDEVVKIRII